MFALCCAHAMTEGSFSMAIMVDHRFDRANAMTLPPAPANMSIRTVFDLSIRAAKSSATLLLTVREGMVEGIEDHTSQLARESHQTTNHQSYIRLHRRVKICCNAGPST